ncbi:MAG: HAMP domain-containing histidine kinase [Bacteroidales bacterium]|jgi:signal transduction histidine kinase|nr:HAMP domain-containing histidine kinase [Bacteroidales bacterium]
MSIWIWIAIIVVAVVVSVVVTFVLTRRHDTKKVSFMMDALEDGELNFRFQEKSSLNRALNRIRGIFERRSAVDESASWSKLFRVITHEIMNTVAPIASLSDALSKEEDLDVKAGLETISESSKDLIRFVESYRSITQVAPPVRKAVMVDELIDRVMRLNKAKIAEQGATLAYQAKTLDLLIYVDEGQIMQVFNNLIKNAVQAGATSIRIIADLNSEDQTVIRVANNGKAIPLRQIEEIFVPFYTTKPNGTGIGLSLSRQIMVRHNGILNLEQSDNQMTVFSLVFK